MSNKDFRECKGCGKIQQNSISCEQCGITTYCSKNCQSNNSVQHKAYFCRQEYSFSVAGADTAPFLMRRQMHLQLAQMVAKSNNRKVEQNRLFCNICGDEQQLNNFNGLVVCKDCVQIQLNM